MITRDETTDFIRRLIANPETEMASVESFLDSIGEVIDSNSTLRDTITAQDEKIRQLQDTNTRLVLAQLGDPAEPDEDQEMTLEEFAHNM